MAGHTHHAVFAFDTVGAEKSLEAAAAAGDERAQAVLAQLAEAEKQLEAQIAVGMVPGNPEPDFLAGKKACDLSGDGACEACQ